MFLQPENSTGVLSLQPLATGQLRGVEGDAMPYHGNCQDSNINFRLNMGYQWERIFKDKTEKELVQIYRGDSHLDFEAGIYAGLELINRNYDFNRIREIHIQRIQQMEGEVERLRKLKFTNTKYFRNMLLGGIPLLGFAGAILQNPPDLGQMDDYHLFQFLVGGFILLAGVVVPKWTYNRFRRRVEREIARNLTLLQKISFPGRDAVPS